MGWRSKSYDHYNNNDHSREFDFEYDKDVDINVNVESEQRFETTVEVYKDIDKEIDIDVDVDLDGNHFEFDGVAELVQKDHNSKWDTLINFGEGTAMDSTDTSTVSVDAFVAKSKDNWDGTGAPFSKIGSNLTFDGQADGYKSYAELAYTFTYDEKAGLTEITVHGEGHGLEG